jgi:hypothetical protein
MATKLGVFNSALLIAGERNLASLTEAREPQRLLTQAWDAGAVDYCLESGQWNFATRASKLTYNASITPAFGLSRAFTKPTDHLRTVGFCSDEYFTSYVNYTEEQGYWYADIDDIYVRYVSNDAAYGKDLSLWPATFTEYVAAYLCSQIIHKLTQDKTERDRVMGLVEKRLDDAKAKDALAEGTKFIPNGSWVRAREGYSVRSNVTRNKPLP